MLFVKILEEKYGGHVQEKQSDLGYIYTSYVGVPASNKHKEMLAFSYIISDSDEEVIGVVRIAVASNDEDGNSGYLELTYTDENARNKTAEEYKTIMDNAL